MTPKQKAEDLVSTYRILLMDEDTDCGNELLCTSIAIKNALVAVDELIKATTPLTSTYYWQEVRQQIKNL
jgi:plasmid rolling circle replication initiator protein Rep